LRHVIADVLGPVGVLGAAFVILLIGWYYADPIIRTLIAPLVFGSSCATR